MREATISEAAFLPPGPSAGNANPCCGGAVLSAHNGRIMVSNTLDSRLEIAFSNNLPLIREMLFGVSETRAFRD